MAVMHFLNLIKSFEIADFGAQFEFRPLELQAMVYYR